MDIAMVAAPGGTSRGTYTAAKEVKQVVLTEQLGTARALPPPVPADEVSHVATLTTFSDSTDEDEGEWESEEGPKPRPRNAICTCCELVIESESWGVAVMLVIFLNTLVMALKCDFKWPTWDVLEDACLLFFTVEIILRLSVHRQNFFTDKDERAWNIFDLLLVVSGLLEKFVAWVVTSHGEEENDAVTMLRNFRILRVLRACRVIRHFKQLHLLVMGFLHSMQAVFWIAILFISVVFVAGIICTTLVGQHAEDWGPPDGSEDDVKQIELLFGSLLSSMITMFQMVTLDNWADICGLVGKRTPSMIVFFIAYTLITAFAMIALLTGVMTENVTSVSSASERQEEELAFARYVDTLESAFRHNSTDMDEGLTVEEFSQLLAEPEVVEGMRAHHMKANFSSEDLTEIFRSLDLSGDGRVSWEEFRTGLKYVQGPAAARQVSLLRADVHQLVEALKGVVGEAAEGDACLADGATPQPSQRLATMEDSLKRLEGRLSEAARLASGRLTARSALGGRAK